MVYLMLKHDIETKIQYDIVTNILQGNYAYAIRYVLVALDVLYDSIPENKRISFGRVYTVQVLSEYLFSSLSKTGANVYEIAATLFNKSEDLQCKGVALGILSFCGIDDYERVLPFFEVSASSEDWEIREFAQMFFRKLIQKHPKEMHSYLLKLAKSEDSNIRRFVSKTLRPVRENRWFYNDPEYPLSILRLFFRESATYPRTSVGNNLSDLARQLPEQVLKIVEGLVRSKDQNAYWIAYRHKEKLEQFCSLLLHVKNNVSKCSVCYAWHENNKKLSFFVHRQNVIGT
jgi:3-methyladenine DNA glycosylase AlkC